MLFISIDNFATYFLFRMPQSFTQLTQLIEVAKDHNVELSQDDIQIIKKSPSDSPLSQWLNSFEPPRLLPPEEAKIWKQLQNANHPLTRPNISAGSSKILTDEFLHTEIINLAASTRQLTSQTSILQTQQSILSRHTKQRQHSHDQLNTAINKFHIHSTSNAQTTHFANSTHLTNLKTQLRSRLESIEKELRALQPTIKERLNADDRALATLQNTLNTTLSSSKTPEDIDAESTRINLLLKALQNATTSELKDRLDRLFLTTYLNDSPEEHSEPDSTAIDSQPTISEITAEIESLYAEIPDMAMMQIQHDHGRGLRRAIDDVARRDKMRRYRACGEAVRKLENMTAHVIRSQEDMERIRGERAVVRTLMGEVEDLERNINRKGRRVGLVARTTKRGSAVVDTAMDRDVNEICETLGTTAQKRREAVSLLVEAMKARSEVGGGIEMLEERIGEVRRGIEGG